MQLFRPDSKWMEALNAFGEMMLLNLCWIIGSLPLVTIGAASTAMYAVMGQRLRGEGSGIFAAFFHAWWRDLLPATAFWLVQILVSASLASSFFLPLPTFFKILSGFFLVLVSLIYPLLYAQLARFRNRWFSYLKNTVILLITKPGWALLNLLIFLAPGIFFLLFPVDFLQYSFIWILFGFSALFYGSAVIMRRILQPLEEKAAK